MEYKTFMSFPNLSQADAVIALLNENSISYKVQDTSKDFDVTFSIDSSKNAFLIMLLETDFDKANQLIEDKIPIDTRTFYSTHPFYTFTIDELTEVVKNYDEWFPADVKLAKELLSNQHIEVAQETIQQQQKQKLLQSQQPEKSSLLTLAMGYTFCIFGGIAGIGIALYLLLGKRKLSNGEKVYVFSKNDRNHGLAMLILGLTGVLIFIFKV
ncbi:MAG: hypothetical protein RLZZ500_432 [Bacteroidota bacterium]